MQVIIIILTCIVLVCICVSFCLVKNLCSVKCYVEVVLKANRPLDLCTSSTKIAKAGRCSLNNAPSEPILINRPTSLPVSQPSLDNPGYISPLSRQLSLSMSNLYFPDYLENIYEEIDENNNDNTDSVSSESAVQIFVDNSSDSAIQSAVE